MASNGTLRVRIVGDSGPFEKTMSGIGGKLATFGKLAGAAMLGVGAAMVGATVKGVQAFANLEAGMNEVFTLLPGITQDAMDGMTAEVRQFSREFGVLPDEVVPALYQALSAGVPQDNVFDFMAIATKASIGGVTDMETAVNGITSVVNNYGEDVVDAQKASDLMFTTVRLGKTDFEQLSASIGNVLPFSAAAGVSFEDVSAAMATMTAKTGKTAESSTQLRQLMVELADGSSDVAESFAEVAGQSFPDFIAGGGDMAGAMAILMEAAEDAGVGVNELFGSVEAGAGALLLSGDNLDDFKGNVDEMGESAGATDEAFKTMDQGLARSWENIKVKFNDLLIELGERVAPALQRFADWFEEQMPAILTWFEETATKVGEVGTAVWDFWNEDAKPALDSFVAAVQDNWPTIQSIIGDLGTVVSDVGDVVNSVFGTMASDVDESTSDMETSVGGFLTVLELFTSTVARYTQATSRSFSIMEGLATDDLATMSRALYNFSPALHDWAGQVGATTANVTYHFRTAGSILSSVMWATAGNIQEAFNAVRTKMNEAVGWFKSLPGRIRAAVGYVGNLLTIAGRELVRGFVRGITGQAASAAAAAVRVVSQVVSAAKRTLRIQSPSKVFEEIGEMTGMGLVEGLEHMLRDVAAAGAGLGAAAVPDVGHVGALGAPAMAGVGGPPRAASGAAGTVNHYTINVQSLDAPSAADAVLRALKVAERQNGPIPIRVTG